MHDTLTTLILFAWMAAVPLGAEQAEAVHAELAEVVAKPLDKTTVVPGELKPFQSVEIHAKISGFVEELNADRGSRVKKGQLLAVMSAPELQARRVEIQAKIPAVKAQLIEAHAKLAAAESTYERLKEAAKTPGVVAGNDVVLAEKAVEAERAKIQSLERNVKAHEASVQAIVEIEKYLHVTAPFDGVVAERRAHLGTLGGPQGEGGRPLFTINQIHRLRLVAAVPEAYTESIVQGRHVSFTVPAYPGQTFTGRVARPAYALSTETRTMPVELDVANSSRQLVPGMYAEVSWPLRRRRDSLFVPSTAVKATTEHIFVIRVRAGRAEWVNVRRGMSQGGLIEVFGDLQAGDTIVLRATDEIRPGTPIAPGSPGGA